MSKLKSRNIIIALTMLIAVSCSTETTVPEKLLITTDKSTFIADGFDEIRISVKTEDGEECTSLSKIFINDRQIAGSVFNTLIAKDYEVRAQKGDGISDTAFVVATDPGPATFSRKVLCEDYTGAWCGYCPRVGIHLDDYVKNNNPECIVVAIHNGDDYAYVYESQMRSSFNVTGFPTVIVNRDFSWKESDTELDRESAKRAALGLALETAMEGTTIKVKVKVKSDVTTAIPMKLVVMLVESDLILPQANYGYGNMQNPITDYNHKNVLRMAATNIFGDDIPTTAIVKNNEWTKDFTFNAAVYKIANCKVVAFVMYGENEESRSGVLNVQEVKAGESQLYD